MGTRKLTILVLGFLGLLMVGCVTPGGPGGGSGTDRGDSVSDAASGRPCNMSAASTRNCFIIELLPPPVGSVQPQGVAGAVGRGGKIPDEDDETSDTMPPTAGEPTVILVAPDTSSDHPANHTHDGGAGGSGHCHFWIKVGTTWYQLHC